MSDDLLTLKEAAEWASEYLSRSVTTYNISYLIQYARIKKLKNSEGIVVVSKNELKEYYDEHIIKKERHWKEKLGKDLIWHLSFDYLREKDTTKHVHRLHSYKGKFIPQLVEYFLDEKINEFKKQIFFHKGDIVLDPFMGSGTTLVQAAELGIHSIGVDISEFNCLITKVKLEDYDITHLNNKLNNAFEKTKKFTEENFNDSFDSELRERISRFNKSFFPNPDFKHAVRAGKINEKDYAKNKINQFFLENEAFLQKKGVSENAHLFNERDMSTFLEKWFSKRIKQELFFYINLIEGVDDEKVQNVMQIVISRTARSCRATTHFDLATLKEPQLKPYYCRKHRKICTPVNTILRHLKKNTFDTIRRLTEFSKLKKKVYFGIIHADSRTVDIPDEINKENPRFYDLLVKKKIDGVFSSPPYVGQIDYHEQHAYSYELFNIPRKDDVEIGPLYKGQGMKARKEYVEGISKVLSNISKFIKDDGNIFIVANDKYDLYPTIAEKSNLVIVNQFKRPVLNRTERDRQPYAEIIFHMKKK